jgi:hypothetical protein
METETEIRDRWRYLRDLLIDQLGRFERGTLQLHSNEVDVSSGAMATLKRHIEDFDQLISRSEARESARNGDAFDPPTETGPQG